jgi:hypothetical protein
VAPRIPGGTCIPGGTEAANLIGGEFEGVVVVVETGCEFGGVVEFHGVVVVEFHGVLVVEFHGVVEFHEVVVVVVPETCEFHRVVEPLGVEVDGFTTLELLFPEVPPNSTSNDRANDKKGDQSNKQLALDRSPEWHSFGGTRMWSTAFFIQTDRVILLGIWAKGCTREFWLASS